MDELQSQAVIDPPAGDDFARLLTRRRHQATELLSSQRTYVERVESEFDSAINQLLARLESSHADDDEARATIEKTAQQLRARADDLSRREADLAADRAEVASRHAELELEREQIGRDRSGGSERLRQDRQQLETRAAEIDAQTTQLRQKERELAASQHEHQMELDQFSRRRTRYEQEQARLEKELEDLEMRREQTRSQRHRIAQQLRAQHAEIGTERDSLEQERIRQQQQIRRDRSALDDELAALEQSRQQLRRERAALDEESAALQIATKKLEEARRMQGRKTLDQSEDLQAAQQQMAELLKERNAFANHIATLEEQLAAAESQTTVQPQTDHQAVEDLHRRCQMALDDVRELKHRNAELEEALASGRSARPIAAPGEACDWAETRRRMVAELESDALAQGKMGEDGRLTVEGAIRITDEIVAQREREIADLKQALADQGAAVSSSDLAAEHISQAAVAEVLDKEELIRAERERLLALQSEWKDKVRQAEVDISVERARMARQRTEMEAQIASLESDKAALAELQAIQSPGGATTDRSKPTHRWLDRLGLKERG